MCNKYTHNYTDKRTDNRVIANYYANEKSSDSFGIILVISLGILLNLFQDVPLLSTISLA